MKMIRNRYRQLLTQIKLNCPLAVNIDPDDHDARIGGALGAGEADETQTEWNIVLAECG